MNDGGGRLVRSTLTALLFCAVATGCASAPPRATLGVKNLPAPRENAPGQPVVRVLELDDRRPAAAPNLVSRFPRIELQAPLAPTVTSDIKKIFGAAGYSTEPVASAIGTNTILGVLTGSISDFSMQYIFVPWIWNTGRQRYVWRARVHLKLSTEDMSAVLWEQEFDVEREFVGSPFGFNTVAVEITQSVYEQLLDKVRQGLPLQRLSDSRPGSAAGQPTGGSGDSRVAGSGFVLRNTNLILTSYHVVKQRKHITLTFPSGASFTGRVVAADAGRDLALVEALGRAASVGGLVLARDTPVKTGETVYAIGYPLGSALSRKPSVVSGQISSTVGMHDDVSQFRTTAPINPGNSGGPIFNQSGQVVGIAAGGVVRTDVAAIRFGIKASAAAVLLQQVAVASPFDIAIQPTGPVPVETIFEQNSPHIVLIEAD